MVIGDLRARERIEGWITLKTFWKCHSVRLPKILHTHALFLFWVTEQGCITLALTWASSYCLTVIVLEGTMPSTGGERSLPLLPSCEASELQCILSWQDLPVGSVIVSWTLLKLSTNSWLDLSAAPQGENHTWNHCWAKPLWLEKS